MMSVLKARQLLAELTTNASLLRHMRTIELVMEAYAEKFDENKVDLFMNELYPGRHMSVPDPWYGTEPGYHEVYKMINEVCDAIIKKYKGKPVAGGRSH